MSDTPRRRTGRLAPGARVRVRVRVGGADGAGGVLGVVVDDYAAHMSAGHDWVPVRRWAVEVDDGTLAFAYDDGIEPTRPDES